MKVTLYRAQHSGSKKLETRLPNLSFGLSLSSASVYYLNPNHKQDKPYKPSMFIVEADIKHTFTSSSSFLELEDVIEKHPELVAELLVIGEDLIMTTDTWAAIKGEFDDLLEWAVHFDSEVEQLCVPLYQLLDSQAGHDWFLKAGYDSVKFKGSGRTSPMYELRLLDATCIESVKII